MSNEAVQLDSNALANLREMVGGDDAILSEIVTTFLSDAPRMLAALHSGIDAGNPDQVRLNAHSLKGNAGDFGALHMAKLCLQLEMMGKTGDLNGAHSLAAQIAREYQGVAQALEDLLASLE
ncbi:MAG: Hpt domain-containing protein [Chloroflexi bacterium]|nr:Hpt domain-containing protein [Chloroflexota bacterium]